MQPTGLNPAAYPARTRKITAGRRDSLATILQLIEDGLLFDENGAAK